MNTRKKPRGAHAGVQDKEKQQTRTRLGNKRFNVTPRYIEQPRLLLIPVQS